MDVYNFRFAEQYNGFWKIKGSRGKSIYGILSIRDGNITLELVDQNLPTEQNPYSFVNEIRGYAYFKESEQKKNCYHFILKDIECRSYSVFGDRMVKTIYDVSYLYVSDRKNFKTNRIRSCCIRNGLMESWVSNITLNSCSFDDTKDIRFGYKQSEPLNLYYSTFERIYLYFSYDYNLPDKNGFRLANKTFLNVEFKKVNHFVDSLNTLSSVHWFFSLIWNNSASPDYFCFRTRDGQFIFKESNKHSFRFTPNDTLIRNNLSDFPEGIFSVLFEKWFLSLKSNYQPIESFFEVVYNDYMNPSSKIKNLLTVIDGLIPNEKAEKVEVAKGCSALLNKVSMHINNKEKKLLKSLMFKAEPFTLKEKIDKALGDLSSYVELKIEEGFSIKVVNTRNVLTHPHKRTNNVYSKEQYRDLTFCLESLIRAFLLLQINMPSDIARKTVGAITSPMMTRDSDIDVRCLKEERRCGTEQ